jgi:hypothetical protein
MLSGYGGILKLRQCLDFSYLNFYTVICASVYITLFLIPRVSREPSAVARLAI